MALSDDLCDLQKPAINHKELVTMPRPAADEMIKPETRKAGAFMVEAEPLVEKVRITSDFPGIPEGVPADVFEKQAVGVHFVKTQDAAEPNGTETFTKHKLLKTKKDALPPTTS